jgi:hypothetical protein
MPEYLFRMVATTARKESAEPKNQTRKKRKRKHPNLNG